MGDDAPQLPKGESRHLKQAEIDLARSVFGNSIDYPSVLVFNGKSTFLQKDSEAVTPNGNIYAADYYSDDFSKENRSLFIHEMTHVWQKQNGVLDPVFAAAGEFIRTGGEYHKAYHYDADPRMDLLHYKIEQQAELVEDYFRYLERGGKPEPPPKEFTAEELEKSPFLSWKLENMNKLHAENPDSWILKTALSGGMFAFDKDGQAHFTKAYADQQNEQNRKWHEESEKKERAMLHIMANFAADPSYANPNRAATAITAEDKCPIVKLPKPA